MGLSIAFDRFSEWHFAFKYQTIAEALCSPTQEQVVVTRYLQERALYTRGIPKIISNFFFFLTDQQEQENKLCLVRGAIY